MGPQTIICRKANDSTTATTWIHSMPRHCWEGGDSRPHLRWSHTRKIPQTIRSVLPQMTNCHPRGPEKIDIIIQRKQDNRTRKLIFFFPILLRGCRKNLFWNMDPSNGFEYSCKITQEPYRLHPWELLEPFRRRPYP